MKFNGQIIDSVMHHGSCGKAAAIRNHHVYNPPGGAEQFDSLTPVAHRDGGSPGNRILHRFADKGKTGAVDRELASSFRFRLGKTIGMLNLRCGPGLYMEGWTG
jgi:hypothetical protein